jgi:competence protein ComEA
MIKTLILLTAIAAVPMWAQDELPDGPGKATTIRICTSCHGAEMWSTSHRSADDWDRTITSMTEKGLSISDADYGVVLDYLSKNLGTQPAKLNVNTATSDQLAKTLGIDPKEADAIVAYRTKNGNFKDLDSLKKVEGLDAAKVDAKKDALSF